MKKFYQAIIFTVTLLCLPSAVTAQSMEDKIRNLEATVEQLQETLLRMRAEMARTKAAEASQEDGVVRTDGEDITLSTTGGGIKIKSDNGNSFQFSGRIMLDYDAFDFGNNEKNKYDASEAEWRRTRITVKGSVKKDWGYGLTINIDDANESADINTAYIKYNGLKPISFTVGKFKEPFGLERLTSSKWISTIERAMILDVVYEGHGQPELGGVMVSGYHAEMGNLNWALGVFDDDREDADGDDNYAFTGRIAVVPHLSEDSFMHLGFAFSERKRDETRYRVRTRFGVHTADDVRQTLADLPRGDDASQWGLEGAFVTGPFSLQAEYMDLEVDGGTSEFLKDEDGNPFRYSDLEGDGYYIQGAYTLTGEQRSYKINGAYFDKIKPEGAPGAWELIARYEEINVEYGGRIGDGDGKADYDAEKMLLGINWYVNNNVKFMLNYIDAESDKNNLDGDAISLRAQYAF